jgi:hypothetical protein
MPLTQSMLPMPICITAPLHSMHSMQKNYNTYSTDSTTDKNKTKISMANVDKNNENINKIGHLSLIFTS